MARLLIVDVPARRRMARLMRSLVLGRMSADDFEAAYSDIEALDSAVDCAATFACANFKAGTLLSRRSDTDRREWARWVLYLMTDQTPFVERVWPLGWRKRLAHFVSLGTVSFVMLQVEQARSWIGALIGLAGWEILYEKCISWLLRRWPRPALVWHEYYPFESPDSLQAACRLANPFAPSA